MAELEKLGPRYRVALRIAKDPSFMRLTCTHKGTYADDCIVNRIKEQKCYIVATCDRDLKRRIRKVPGVPIMYISNHRYSRLARNTQPVFTRARANYPDTLSSACPTRLAVRIIITLLLKN